MAEPEKYLRPDECRSPEDLERLRPNDYARLVSTPVTQLDLMRSHLTLKESAEEAFAAHTEAIEELDRRIASQ